MLKLCAQLSRPEYLKYLLYWRFLLLYLYYLRRVVMNLWAAVPSYFWTRVCQTNFLIKVAHRCQALLLWSEMGRCRALYFLQSSLSCFCFLLMKWIIGSITSVQSCQFICPTFQSKYLSYGILGLSPQWVSLQDSYRCLFLKYCCCFSLKKVFKC